MFKNYTLFGVLILLAAMLIYIGLEKSGIDWKSSSQQRSKNINVKLAEKIRRFEQLPQDVVFTTHNGRVANFNILKGKPTLMYMMFTSCPDVCPRVTQTIKEILKKTGTQADVQVLGVTVNPQVDSPEVLSDFMKKHDLNSENWTFANLGKSRTLEFAREIAKLSYSAENVSMHSERVVLIDEALTIRGYYLTSDKDDRETLTQTLELMHSKTIENLSSFKNTTQTTTF